jgi:hypothetical protein
MVSKQDIQKIIADKSELLHVNSTDLKSAVDYFPFASSFSLLYLESLLLKGDLSFHEELKRLAIRFNDRTVLYDLVNGLEKLENTSVDEELQLPVMTVVRDETIESPINSELDTSENEISLNDTSVSNEKGLDDKSVNTKLQDDAIELLIQAGAVQAGYALETEKLQEKEDISTGNENSSNIAVNDQTNSKISPKNVDFTIDLEKEFSFNQWLSFTNSNQELTQELPEKPVVIETILRPKKEFYSPSKKAKESLDEQKMPVSETLAKIFELQGNFPKAIYVYEQLSLIFPEKNAYFATQIKQVKKKIN